MKGLQCEGYSINKVKIWKKRQVNIFQIFFWGKKKSALFEIGLLYKTVSIFLFNVKVKNFLSLINFRNIRNMHFLFFSHLNKLSHSNAWPGTASTYIYIYIYISSSSCCAASTDIPDPLSPLLPIVHRLRQIFIPYPHRAAVCMFELVVLLLDKYI